MAQYQAHINQDIRQQSANLPANIWLSKPVTHTDRNVPLIGQRGGMKYSPVTQLSTKT